MTFRRAGPRSPVRRELLVFGSILREEFRPDSDVDVLAVFHDDAQWDLFDTFQMQDEMSGPAGPKVDMRTRYAVERDSDRYFRAEVLGTAERVYAA